MKVAFLTSAGRVQDLAYTLAAAHAPEHDWQRLVLDSPESREAFESSDASDLIISFLNPHIVSAERLEGAQLGGYNVHPGTPAHPGQLPFHFAAYEGDWMAGATLHRMVSSVDAGPIFDAWEQPVDPAGGVRALVERSKQLALGVLIKNLAALLAGRLEPSGRQWSDRAPHTMRDFEALARIEPGIDAGELQRRLVAFASPEQRTPYVEIHGLRFHYDGSGAASSAATRDGPTTGGVSAAEVRAFVLESLEPELRAAGVSADEVPDHFDFHAAGVIDSFGILELIASLEERFEVEIDFEELDPEDLTILGPFCSFVEQQSEAAAA